MADMGGTVRQGTEADGFRPTGEQLFHALTKEQQDEKIGPEAAALVRDGAPLEDFVSHSETETDQPNWITQRPVEDVPATTN